MYCNQLIAVVIPALNEVSNIRYVVQSLKSLKNESNLGLVDDVIVCDNGSHDNTAALALLSGATVVHEPQRGYGAACIKALSAVKHADIIVFVDADRSIDVQQLALLLNPLCLGSKSKAVDLVIGSRSKGVIEDGSMTWPQRAGTRLATWLIRSLWCTDTTDLGPFRAIKARALNQLDMRDQKFGWTVEMQLKAIQHQLTTIEVPVRSIKRHGKSKISGTLAGTIGAAYGILSTITLFWWHQRKVNGISRDNRFVKTDK